VGVGESLLRQRRPVAKGHELVNGPGKLCEAMGINFDLNGADLCDARSPLFIAQNPEVEKFRKERGPLVTTVRVGITRAAALPLRFYLAGSEFVSRRDGGALESRATRGEKR